MARYTFDPSAVFVGKEKADADTVGEQLEIIARDNGGRLQPAAVVKAASKRTHPLHQLFEWRDKVAADAYRLDQARTLIRSVRIVSPDADEPRHAFLSISDKHGVAYHALHEITGSRELQLALLRGAERDLIAWERRYRNLNDICELVRLARERTSDKIKHESRPQQ